MPQLVYKGDFGSSQTLNTTRTTSLTKESGGSTWPMLVQSAYARIYISTTRSPYTYQLHVSTNDGYYGDLSYKFSAVDTPIYVNVPISVDALDPSFPVTGINTISVSDTTSGHGDSVRIRGTVRIYVNYVEVGPPTPPSNIRINGETGINIEAGTTARLTWTRAYLNEYDTFVFYRVRRYDVESGADIILGNTQDLYYDITAPYTDSKSYYFYVDVLTIKHYVQSSTFASIYTYIQLTEPVFLGGGTNPVYNPRPMLLVTLGEGPLGEYMTLVADGWTPSRRGYPGDHIYLRRNAGYAGNTSETVSVTETDERMRSVTTALEVNYAAPTYTNPAIVAGETIVRAADITELQNILAQLRTAYGMEPYTFTPCVAGVTSLTLWPTHVAELQACIRDIQTFVNAWDTQSPSWAVILPTMLTSSGPSAAVLTQLRQMVTLL